MIDYQQKVQTLELKVADWKSEFNTQKTKVDSQTIEITELRIANSRLEEDLSKTRTERSSWYEAHTAIKQQLETEQDSHALCKKKLMTTKLRGGLN